MYKVGLDISALDQRFKEHAWRGTGRYVRSLKGYFDKFNSKQNTIVDLATKERDTKNNDIEVGYFDHSIAKNSSLYNLSDQLPLAKKTISQQIAYPISLQKQTATNFDVLHFPAHVDAPCWGVKNSIVTVLDLIPLVLADLYRAERPNWRFRFGRWLELKAIQNAGLILAISENTANDLVRLLHVERERIVVTPLGVDQSYLNYNLIVDPREARRKYDIPGNAPILLSVGGIDPRKNWRALLEILKGYIEKYREDHIDEPVLCFVGRLEKDDQYPLLRRMIERLNLTNNVRFTGYLEESELFKIYRSSSLLLFPSLYEGFGLTPLEAMALGTPVACSSNSSLPEVVGDAALTFNPTDISSAIEAVRVILTDDQLALRLSKQGKERAKLFSWDSTGEKTLLAYSKFFQTFNQRKAA